ncbi:hypothetical protein ANTQUA_LOCUS4989 [Anthophora quadrimaculata]
MKAIFVVVLATILVAVAYTTEAVECPPHDGEDVVLLPNPEDCSTFYSCDEGVPYLMECSKGLEFDPIERVCNWPEYANCKPVTCSTEETTVETTDGSTVETTDGSTVETTDGSTVETTDGCTGTTIESSDSDMIFI